MRILEQLEPTRVCSCSAGTCVSNVKVTSLVFDSQAVASSPGSDARLGLDVVEGGRTALDNKTSLLNTPSPRSFSGPRAREYTPYGFGETICTYDKSALKEAVFDDDVEQFRDCEFMCNTIVLPPFASGERPSGSFLSCSRPPSPQILLLQL